MQLHLLVAEAVQDAASHLQEDVRRHLVQVLQLDALASVPISLPSMLSIQ